MEAPKSSGNFESELTDIVSGMAGLDSATALSRVAIDPFANPESATQPKTLSEERLEALARIQGVEGAAVGASKWLTSVEPTELSNIIKIKNGQMTGPLLVTAGLGQQGQRFAQFYPRIAEDVATARIWGGMTGLLRSLGYSDRDAQDFVDAEYPKARKEVYVTGEGGQIMVEGSVIEVPGKGQIHVQKLAPQGYFADAQVVFAPQDSRVVPYRPAA